MTTVTATFAKNNMGEVWEMAKEGPVEVLSNGNPVAVILSPDQFKALTKGPPLGRARRLGALADAAKGFDSDAFLDTDVSEAFADYAAS